MSSKVTPMRQIRKKCLECCCGNPVEVRLCDITSCPLHIYRFGHRPQQEPAEVEDMEGDENE